MIQHPPYLKKGSRIGITCPSGYVSEDRVRYCIEMLELWGFETVKGKTVGTEHFYFSGTDDARLNDLQEMLDDTSIDAILMGRGGYGLSRIIDRVDLTAFKKNPKWICGFSDVTVLHSHIHTALQIPTLHSVMCGAFKPETTNTPHLKSFYAAIMGESLYYHSEPSIHNRIGSAEGIVVGGNLAMLAHMTGSASEIDTTEKILLIEDIGEHLYNIDRMLLNLKRAGKLDKLRGLLVGGFTDMQDTERPFGQTVEEIIWDKVKEYNYPVCYNMPFGHQDINYTLTLGMTHKLKVTEQGGHLELVKSYNRFQADIPPERLNKLR